MWIRIWRCIESKPCQVYTEDKRVLLLSFCTDMTTDTIKFPIDPFSTAYWPKPKGMEQTISKVASSSGPIKATLHAYSTNATTHTSSPLAPSTRQVTAADSTVTVKGKKPFPPEHMAEFKEIVEGCDLTKAGLIEVLKKR